MVEQSNSTFDKLSSVQALKAHFDGVTSNTHLRALLNDEQRNAKLRVDHSDQFIFDFTHAKIDEEGFAKLLAVAEEAKLFDKIEALFSG